LGPDGNILERRDYAHDSNVAALAKAMADHNVRSCAFDTALVDYATKMLAVAIDSERHAEAAEQESI
jgi:hypothetical protein